MSDTVTTNEINEPGEGWFRGTGGAIWRMALPLAPDLAAAHAAGQLVRVNPDGTPYTGPSTVPPMTAPPSAKAGKRAWVEWAVACGADPEEAAAVTKHDLIDTYGQARPTSPPAVDQPDKGTARQGALDDEE
ncbi:hypothetical protein ABZ801_01065 [Actinomadura sp. NPDC047616]|uniref:hypothetical protein n=1 Tax=Actinomadura sp. NPDC047616 TaxID=3155914 RepID=UPI0033F9F339